MKMTPKILFSLSLIALLGGCFQVGVGGPSGGADVTIAPLRTPGNILITARTLDEGDWIAARGQEQWDGANALLKLLVLGIANPNTDSLDPNTLYLVTATGGTDYDPQSGGSISDNPLSIQGNWHAIASGQRIIDGNIQVSALSEALYQQVQGRLGVLNDTQVSEQLDAAARLVVTDVDDNGDVDYNDVLRWSRTLHSGNYLGDIAAITAQVEGITNGQPADMLETLAVEVLGRRQLTLSTSFGDIELETLNWEAPVTADNFLRYVADNFYNDIVFHRTIDDFMIQTGLWELQPGTNIVAPKETRDPIRNESRFSVSNERGTIAMARTSNPDSASSQFFINQNPAGNDFLDYGSADNPDGYTVFARVIAGMDVVDSIAALPTGSVSGIGNDVPAEIVLIETITE